MDRIEVKLEHNHKFSNIDTLKYIKKCTECNIIIFNDCKTFGNDIWQYNIHDIMNLNSIEELFCNYRIVKEIIK